MADGALAEGPSTQVLPERVTFTSAPTPLQPMDRLAAALGKPAGTLWVKRDDLTGLSAGGNKVRKLEYVVAQALSDGADYLVTGGGVQSNAARATAAAAARHGLRCRLVLDGEAPPRLSGNLALDHLLGAEVSFCRATDDNDLGAHIRQAVQDLTEQGHRPFLVPVGASNPLGALGYVRAVDELAEQLPAAELVVVATGSAGTHAGLVAGFGDHARVLGVRVGERPALGERVETMARATAELAGRSVPVGQCQLDEDHLGAGYAQHTEHGFAAIELAARTEGLVLDPVYTGKAMAALISRCRDGRIPPEQTVVFLHTGGMPGLLSFGFVEQCAEHAAGN